jgi:hypothetical protein
MDPASRPQTYRITVEEADGSTHEHQLVLADRRLSIGVVLEPGQSGWDGPRVTVEEIDRHPNADTPGAALAWPLMAYARPHLRLVPQRTL